MKYLAVVFTMALVWGATAAADSRGPLFSVDVKTQKSQSEVLVELKLKDAYSKTGMCPYFLQALQYVPSLNVLNLDMSQGVCSNDAYGKSEGTVYWVVPRPFLTGTSNKLCLVVNQGKVATLVYDEASRSFRVTAYERCD